MPSMAEMAAASQERYLKLKKSGERDEINIYMMTENKIKVVSTPRIKNVDKSEALILENLP